MSKQKTSVTNPKLAQLLDLMKENPHLPIVPMVDSEVVADDGYNFWMGSWSKSYIDEYLIANERLYFKDSDDPFDVLERINYHRKLDDMTDEEIDAAYDNLPWKKAIFVYITTPEE